MSNKTVFKEVSDHPNFSQEEEIIYQYWNQINILQRSIDHNKDKQQFNFYDGPPFATGMPHYGNLLAGTIKDVVCRYASQTGFKVHQRFGWDCHGLPIEFEIDKKLGISGRNDVLAMGIENYNAECRAIVMRYSQEWRYIVGRMGRWADFENDYKTLNITYMESVWHVFKEIWKKDLVYRGCRVMPYSNACNTVLSNFETQQNYKEVIDPAIVISFPLVEDPDTSFIAWTTTPWTLPSNLILAVNPKFEYVKCEEVKTGNKYILAKCRLIEMWSKPAQYKILETYQGIDLMGKSYIPLFEYFRSREQDGAFKVYCADFVTSDAGTGIVHCAPGFGPDDFEICKKYKVVTVSNPPCPVDVNGCYTEEITEYFGRAAKDCDKDIRKDLRNRGRLIKDDQVKHNYPFCWRSDTPLMFKAVNQWFINVSSIQEDLVKNNKKSNWVPKHIQDGRFNNWIANAQDWCFTRSRFWGNPVPIWVSEDYEEQICIGSIEELKRLSGTKEDIKDLHRESIDHITIPSQKGKGVLRRIEEVFDCWFESGSMPYGQVHYPFSCNEEEFNKIFPAEFIAEGLDQTRGWFYTMLVIGTIVKDQCPFKNNIVNGIVQAEDGKKMSKSKKNYPDPMEIVREYGADAIRLYMINSPLVRAQELNFKKAGVFGVIKDIFLPWYNAYRFLIIQIERYEQINNKKFIFDEEFAQNPSNLKNQMDSWITGKAQSLFKWVKQEMLQYKLYSVVPEVIEFLEDLTNWYVRLNRLRLKGDHGNEEMLLSLNVLFNVILKETILMCPYTPFITEMMYQNLRKVIPQGKYQNDSVHFIDIPQAKEELINSEFETAVKNMQNIINTTRAVKEKKKISLKQPCQSLTIITDDKALIVGCGTLTNYIKEEINTPSVEFEQNIQKYIKVAANPNHRSIGAKRAEFNKNNKKDEPKEEKKDEKKGKKKEKVVDQFLVKLKNLTEQDVNGLVKTGSITIEGVVLTTEDFEIKNEFKTDQLQSYQILESCGNFSVILDTRQDDKLKLQGLSREITSRLQKLRKSAGMKATDNIIIFYECTEKSQINAAIQQEKENIDIIIKKPFLSISKKQQQCVIRAKEKFEIEGEEITFVICYEELHFNLDAIKGIANGKEKQLAAIASAYKLSEFIEIINKNNGNFDCVLDNEKYSLKKDTHFSINWQNLK